MSYESTDGLMRHLRESGIQISGEKHKRQLRHTGYYHGYKGYRFFGNSRTRLPFTNYDEIEATIRYDLELKALFYRSVMFIETAVRNISLERILEAVRSEKIADMMDRAVCGYNNAPPGATARRKMSLQANKLNLLKSIRSNLAYAYRKGNPIVTHFYNKGCADVPVWAFFEIMTMGDFGHLLQCLTYDVRDDISRRLGLNVSCDTERLLICKFVFLLKDLRNAVAHNAVVFDARFRSFDPNKAMKQCLKLELGVPGVNFDCIGDYVLLMGYFLKLLRVERPELEAFVGEFERRTENFRSSVNPNVAAVAIRPDLPARMRALKNYFARGLEKSERTE